MKMGNMVKVTYYSELRENSHVIDFVVQPEVSVVWEPALADIQQDNIRGLMTLANITPSAWRRHLIDHFGFDVLSPTPEGLRRVGVSAERVEWAMEMALRQKENWEIQEDIDDLWTWTDEYHSNLTPAQVYEVLAETGARGTPVISFQADEAELLEALAEDNVITIKGEDGVYVGLSDPVNGYNWSPERLTGDVSFRPSDHGLVVMGDDHLWQDVVEDAYTATVGFAAGREVLMSSRSEETSRFPPPAVRDTRAPTLAADRGPKL
ncbi:hypothetical protein OIU34_17380 [Pararhizobium sp. BT-229]|uniref:hypothetical protein n=1 Tax=Pararhizobium sp. BT-229 TaxID=2986923 RepID=UPI0021F72E95|nr:hypothetical protein [Pararhizobium sp. BT-229]MCV9963675.1 hypothetical protein [Pararhizobium sp. BT-229]